MHICRSSKKIMDKRFGILCMVGAALLALAQPNLPGQTLPAGPHTPPLPVPDWSFVYIPTSADPLTEKPLFPYANLIKGYEYLIKAHGNPGTYDLKLDLRTLPHHDDFENALPVIFPQTGNALPPVNFKQYNIHATQQAAEPTVVYRGSTLWYMLNAPNGRMTVTISTAGFTKPLQKPYVTIWKSSPDGPPNLAELSFYAENRLPLTNSVDPYAFLPEFNFAVRKDTTYFMRLDAAETEGEFSVRCSFRYDAPNDNLSQALAIALAAVQYDNGIRYTNTVHGNNHGASTQTGEPLDLQRTVWYRFAAPAAGYAHVSLGSNINHSATLFTGPASASSFGQLARVTAPVPVSKDQNLYVAIGGEEEGEFDLPVSVTQPPANDYFTNSIPINQSRQTLIYNYYSKLDETLDYAIPGVNNSLWWNVTPVETGTLSLRSVDGNFSQDYWRLMALDQGDYRAINPVTQSPGLKTFNVNAGEPCFLWFAVPNDEIGEGQLSFELWANPANDDFGQPVDITDFTTATYSNGEVRKYSLAGRNNGSTDPSEPLPHTVWYRWTSPGTGHLDTTISSSVVSLLTGSVPDGSSNAATFQTIATPTTVVRDQIVTFAVGGNYDQYTLASDFRPTPDNDEPTAPMAIVLGDKYTLYTRYANLSPADVAGASDIWFTYDPTQFAGPIEFRLNPDANGKPVTLQLAQAGQPLASHTFNNRGEEPFTVDIPPNGLVTVRAICAFTDTDFDLIATYRAINDDFANRMLLTLEPRSWDVSTPAGPVTMRDYYRRVVVNNRNAGVESSEAGPNRQEAARLSGKSLWWEFTTPNEFGTLSIKSRPGCPPLLYLLTTNSVMPTSPLDYCAWNRIAIGNPWYSGDRYPATSQSVILNAEPRTTYRLRMDTQLGYEDQLMDFDIMVVPYPLNDFMQRPTPIPIQETTSVSTYKNRYQVKASSYQGSVTGSIYGGTRQAIATTLDGDIIETSAIYARYASSVQDFPYGQSTWFKVQTPDARSYTFTTFGSSFRPFVAISDGFPSYTGMKYLPDGGQYILQPNKDYYVLIDALVPLAQYLNSFGRLPHMGLVNTYGLANDINRAGPEEIAGAVNLRLYTAEQTPNNLFELASPIVLKPAYLPGTNTACGDYVSLLYGYGIGDNTMATKENAAYDDFPGGAGKTLWWKVTAVKSDLLRFDLTDGACPVVTRLFNDSSRASWVSYTNKQFQILAEAGHTYYLGVDSLSGYSGMIVLVASQTPDAPNNDNFVNAREITSPITCGIIDNATLEPGESLTGTGSVWFQWHNYSRNEEPVAFALYADPAKRMSIYRGSSLNSLLPVHLDDTGLSYVAQPGENLALRVYDRNYPVKGEFQIGLNIGTNYYVGQVDITPSTIFTNSLLVEARSMSSARPLIFYSTNGAAGPGSPVFENRVLTNSARMNFFVQFPNGPAFSIAREYILAPDIRLTPSQTFKGLLAVSLTNAPPGTVATYAIGDGNGNPPASAPNLPFDNLPLTESAHLVVRVATPGFDMFTLEGHYTNTVADITAQMLEGDQLELATTTPQAALQVRQGLGTQSYNTNQILITPDYPILDVIASRTGWQSATTQIDLSTNYTMSLLPLVLETNTVTSSHLQLTLTDPNVGSYIWYRIARPDGSVLSSRATNTFALNAPYTFDLEAFPASPILSRRGPSTNVHFTAKLQMPAIVQDAQGLIEITDPNEGADSSLVVNGTPLGITNWIMPYDGEGTITASAMSPIAENSDTNSLTVSYAPFIAVTPPTATFTTNVTVHIHSSIGSRLRVSLNQEGQHHETYLLTRNTDLIIDRPTVLIAQAERYGAVHSASTNIYRAKVSAPTVELPTPQDGKYPILTPVVLNTTTPGATFQYAIDFSPWNNSSGLAYLQDGSHTYRFKAVKPYWEDSDTVTMSLTGYTPEVSLVNYVSPYWTILPGITTRVYATNAALASTPFVQFIHQVWLTGGSPGDFIPLDAPVTNLLVWHRVVKVIREDGIGVTSIVEGLPQATLIEAHYFDFRVDDPDPRLQVGPGTEDSIFFYKPVWLESASSNVVLQAVGTSVAYDLTPIRQGNRWLIPGNFMDQDHVTLRYRASPDGPPGNWRTFIMRFKTLEPDQYVAATNSAQIIVQLDPNYAGHPVGAYYESAAAPPDTSQPLANPIELRDLMGSFSFSSQTTNQMYWINSKYILTNWSAPDGPPGIDLYTNLPAIPLTQ